MRSDFRRMMLMQEDADAHASRRRDGKGMARLIPGSSPRRAMTAFSGQYVAPALNLLLSETTSSSVEKRGFSNGSERMPNRFISPLPEAVTW